jgi:hypothetical protein
MDFFGDLLVASSTQKFVFRGSPQSSLGVDVPSGSRHALTHEERR